MNNTNWKAIAIVAGIWIVVFTLAILPFDSRAEGLFDGPGIFDIEPKKSDTTSIWKDDGSLVIINGADEAGYIVKGDNSGNEIEYYVKPKDDGSPTFIYDNELIICTNTGGCY